MALNSKTPLPKISEKNDALIDTLFDKFRKTKTGLSKRLRARAIFKEIDLMSTQDFNKLIGISRDRFVHIKAGNEMNKELRESILAYNREIAAKKEKANDLDILIRGIMRLPCGQLKKLLTSDIIEILEKYGISME